MSSIHKKTHHHHRRRRHGLVDVLQQVHGPKNAMDLFVILPPSLKQPQPQQLQQQQQIEHMILRLYHLGYTTIALTHVIYGIPKYPNDIVTNTIPMIESIPKHIHGIQIIQQPQKPHTNHQSQTKSMTIKRRLHMIIENILDMSIFTSSNTNATSTNTTTIEQLFAGYDIISISPRTEAIFQLACTIPNYIDIITVDGGIHNTTSSSSSSTTIMNRLPYTIRSIDVQRIHDHQMTIEIPYSISILNRLSRKGFIQTCQSILSLLSTLSSKQQQLSPNIIISSGPRICLDSRQMNDIGSGSSYIYAFRSSGDIINLLHTILRFHTKTAIHTITTSGNVVLQHGQQRINSSNSMMSRKQQLNKSDSTTIPSQQSQHLKIIQIDINTTLPYDDNNNTNHMKTTTPISVPISSNDNHHPIVIKTKSNEMNNNNSINMKKLDDCHIDDQNNIDDDDNDGFLAF